MANKKNENTSQKDQLSLKIPRNEAEGRLNKRLVDGNDMLQTIPIAEHQYEELRQKYSKWNDFNLMLFRTIFTNDEINQQYNKAVPTVLADSWVTAYDNLKRSLRRKLTILESTIERLVLIPESTEIMTPSGVEEPKITKPAAVFIGHGRSKLWARVKTFLHDDFGINSFTFESETHVGESIVPVLEGFLERASFAIVILTAEDETADGTIRARQNVVHEAGLFQGRLGFKKAILLRQDGLDNFSNVDGLQYIGFTGDNIEQTFYELTRVLKREGVIN
ncbi:TIR domain-containing protein [Paenibacillus sp. TAF43_2]|uniref:TIR domain-containing protein n=1 Tax=Paenibacillus sp. TAF43_2 TaxID=3233069 RepID=UPI003F990A45